jgi:hypothetical protein
MAAGTNEMWNQQKQNQNQKQKQKNNGSMEGQEPRLTTQTATLSTHLRELNQRSPKSSGTDQLVAIEINGRSIRRSPTPRDN